jgi:hypothetical protein
MDEARIWKNPRTEKGGKELLNFKSSTIRLLIKAKKKKLGRMKW